MTRVENRTGWRFAVEELKELVCGNPRLELVARRVEQVEVLLERMALLRAAGDAPERSSLERGVSAAEAELRGPICVRIGREE
jgi:hypothetical protein